MASEVKELHFVLIPLLSPGHVIPMVDMAKLLATHGIIVTIVTTPLNAVKFTSTIQRFTDSGLQIRLLHLHFPATEAGLPPGCENMEKLPSRDLIRNFYTALTMLQDQFEQAFHTLHPRPSCIISGKNLPWTVQTARKFGIPRIFFDGMGCFSFCCTHQIESSQVHQNKSNSETFLVPNLPDRIELTRAKLPENLNPGSPDLSDVRDSIKAVESIADGIVVNTFEELESEYVKMFKKVKGDEKVWCIGPVSACNRLKSDKSERCQNESETDSTELITWLDKRSPSSVIYACLGSIPGLTTPQWIELGLGLETSTHSFIWVIRKGEKSENLLKWIEIERFEERNKGRGIIIKGWSPQVLILSHPSIGCFLTHCGWNSTLEGVSAGVPIVTCPLFAEQFYNERLVVDVLKIGVSVGVESAVTWGLEHKFGVVMKREDVRKAVEVVMEKGGEGDERRRRAREIGEVARNAIEEGGSSYFNVKMLIQFVQDSIKNYV
ncbi:UDP-glycosyltransferase 73C3-like [Euphorbia lathyris]|uniref:UDP-glycosyltransferase 73C3-like n=1 Tax=Euphorbia lathyris TaxID=212925 RepID=UPI0033139757